MKIVQSTWVRYHHFDLAGHLEQMGYLEKIFTCLPWWKAEKESREMKIPRDKIACNFLLQGIRHLGNRIGYGASIDSRLGIAQTKTFSRWVASNLPECDLYIGISGSGLHAGRVAQQRGGSYIMDRGSTQIRYADTVLAEEHKRFNIPWKRIDPWYIENEEAEAEIADAITVPSHFVQNTFIQNGTPAKKVKVIPYAVSLEEFHQVPTKDDEVFRLIFAGQVCVRKGVPYLLEAFKKFQHPNKELVFVGDVKDEIKPLLATYSDQPIKTIGSVPRHHLKQYFSTAKALVLPSIEEGLALVQAQAMACGCPVIATPNTGSETLFTNMKEGLIIDARNTDALVNAFTFLADNPQVQLEMKAAALDRAQQLGGWRAYAKRVVSLAEQLCENELA